MTIRDALTLARDAATYGYTYADARTLRRAVDALWTSTRAADYASEIQVLEDHLTWICPQQPQ